MYVCEQFQMVVLIFGLLIVLRNAALNNTRHKFFLFNNNADNYISTATLTTLGFYLLGMNLSQYFSKLSN